MHIFLSSDHGGFALKEVIKTYLQEQGSEVMDFGVHTAEPRVDYPDRVVNVAKEVVAGHGLGILFCGNGVGVCIAANKLPGIRAALCTDPYNAMLARKDDDANVLCLGGRTIGPEMAKAIVDAFLTTKFGEGRYRARLEKLSKLEDQQFSYGD